MKGLSTFLRQGIYLVALFFFLSVVTVSIAEYSSRTYEAGERAMLAQKAMEMMDIMVERCFNGSVNTSMLDHYQQNPSELRKCVDSYEFEYWLEAVILEQEWEGVDASSSEGKRYIVLIIDTSGSMDADIGGRKRMDIARRGILKFLEECSSPDDRFAILTYDAPVTAGSCDSGTYVKTEAEDVDAGRAGDVVSGIFPRYSNTPIMASLRKAASMASSKPGYDELRIILFTDGGDTCIKDYAGINNRICGDNADLAPSVRRGERMETLARRHYARIVSMLPPFDGKVYTVGFALTDRCREVADGDIGVGDVYGRVMLMDIAARYGGRYFEVSTAEEVRDAFCKSLQSLSTPPPTERRTWEIGRVDHPGLVISRSVIIRDGSGSYPGLLKIHVLTGDEIRLAKDIELACEGIGTVFEGTVSDFEIRPDRFCFGGTCIDRRCKKPVSRTKINAGRRKLFIRPSGETVEII